MSLDLHVTVTVEFDTIANTSHFSWSGKSYIKTCTVHVFQQLQSNFSPWSPIMDEKLKRIFKKKIFNNFEWSQFVIHKPPYNIKRLQWSNIKISQQFHANLTQAKRVSNQVQIVWVVLTEPHVKHAICFVEHQVRHPL